MSVGVGVAQALNAHVKAGGNFNMMMLGGTKTQYKPVLDGKSLGMYGSYKSGIEAASKVASLKAKTYEIMGAQSMLGGYNSMYKVPTMFVGNDSFSATVDQLGWNDGNMTSIATIIPKIVNVAGQVVSAYIADSAADALCEWVEGIFTPWFQNYAIYLGGRLIANVDAEELPKILRSYRTRGLRLQIKRSMKNGPRAVIRPRTRAHNVNF